MDNRVATMDQVHEPWEAWSPEGVSMGRLYSSGPALSARFLRSTTRLNNQSGIMEEAMVGMTRAGGLIRDRAGPCA